MDPTTNPHALAMLQALQNGGAPQAELVPPQADPNVQGMAPLDQQGQMAPQAYGALMAPPPMAAPPQGLY